MTPKVSIVTLTQDRAQYLAEAIASVEAQTEKDFEHLVYDNDSRDPAVLGVLRGAKARHPERFFFTSPGARGPVVPALYWNVLLGLSRGRYCAILDDDNRLRKDFLAQMTAPLDADRAVAAVSCGWALVDAGGHYTGEEYHWNLLTTIPKLWQSNTIDSNAIVFRREVLDQIGFFSPHLETCEDWHFIVRLARAKRIVHLSEALLAKRVHPGARSHRVPQSSLFANWNRIRETLFSQDEIATATSAALFPQEEAATVAAARAAKDT